MYRISRTVFTPILLFVLPAVLAVESSAQTQNNAGVRQSRSPISLLDSTRDQDGLVGSVWRVKIESAKIGVQDGRPTEGPRQLLELTTYGIKGNRVENTTYPSGDSPIGKEEYKYDDHGNIIQMTIRDDHGAALSREAYAYEFDTIGNWTKMVTSLVVFENGQLKREPVEVTYRTVTYYFSDSMANTVDVSSALKTSKVTESTELQPATQEKDRILNTAGELNVSSTPSESPSAASSLTSYPSREVTRPATDNRSNDETVAARGAGSSGVGSVSSFTAPSAINAAGTGGPPLNKDEPIESKPKDQVSVSSTARNSSAVEASLPKASPANFRPSDDVAAQKNASDYYHAGTALLDAGNVKGAVEAYLESIKIDPKSAEVFFSLGSAYVKLDKDNDAAKAFKQAVKFNPDWAEAQYGLGLSSFRLKRYTDAVAAFKKATNLSPKMAKAHFGLASAYQELGQNNSVVEEYRILQKLDQDLAKKLARTFPNNSFGCQLLPQCR
jgi:TolA-binding protein